MKKDNREPWKNLDAYRGKYFFSEWPTVAQMFEISAARYPDSPCFSSFGEDGVSFTYGEVLSYARRIASYLVSVGVGKDTHIAVTGKNSPQWGIAFLGVVLSGAVVVPLDCAFNRDELLHILEFGDVDYVFGDADRLSYCADAVRGSFCLEHGKGRPYVLDIEGDPKDLDRAYRAKEEDTAAILFTSGTTGNPKGVMLSHRNLIGCTFTAQGYMNIYNSDTFYAILPIHHAYTLQAVFLETLSVGAHLVFGKKLVVSRLLKDMDEGKVTMFLGVPMLYNKLYKGLMEGVAKKGKLALFAVKTMMGISGFLRDVFKINIGKKVFKGLLSKIGMGSNRICISGGGPLPEETSKGFHKLGIDFVQGYGMTETSPITHLDPIWAYKSDSVGKLLSCLEQKISDPDSEGNGVLMIRGLCVMQGYYKNPEETAKVLDKDGWLDTGDVGHIDSEGYLYLTGRAKNVIVTEGGKNVFPEEIEDMFQLYDELEQVCVVGYEADVKMHTESVQLLTFPSQKLVNSFNGEAEKVLEHINGIVSDVNRKLPSYKKITKVTVLDEPLPTTSTKKIKRAEVKKQFDHAS